MDLSVLVTEIAKPEYAGMTDQQIADAVNAKTVSVRQLVPTWLVKQHAIENGYYATIKIYSCDSTIPVAVRGLCISAHAMVSGLIASSIMTQAQATSLDQLADHDVRWVDHVGLGDVGIGYITLARRQS
jgi:hypothetical protein